MPDTPTNPQLPKQQDAPLTDYEKSVLVHQLANAVRSEVLSKIGWAIVIVATVLSVVGIGVFAEIYGSANEGNAEQRESWAQRDFAGWRGREMWRTRGAVACGRGLMGGDPGRLAVMRR